MISAWTSKKRAISCCSSNVNPSREASASNASMIPFSQSIRVP